MADWAVELILRLTGQLPVAGTGGTQPSDSSETSSSSAVCTTCGGKRLNGYRRHSATTSTVASSYEALSKEQVIALRQQAVGSACTTFFSSSPILVSHARGQYVFDEGGNRYLDCISNVQHVGHSHPEVVAAVAHQMGQANCNMRFLHGALSQLTNQLTSLLPRPLDTVYMTNSGSEANDLALRLARDFTGGTDVIVLEHGYHGHLTSTICMSHYKYSRLEDPWRPDWVHTAPIPDVYRGRHRLSDEDMHDEVKLAEAARLYADEVGNIVVKRIIDEQIVGRGRRLCMMLVEALISCGGQVVPPNGYFDEVIRHVHAAGGLFVVDEVQTGFGRAGCSFWAWQSHSDVVPDIVTMGKPMGNGFPVSALVTRKEISDVLGRHVEYFNTYGGNPVSCAAALAVLRVIERDRLQAHAAEVGLYFIEQLRQLRTLHANMGHIRGIGLFLGIEFVTDRATREPATQLAKQLILNAKDSANILLSAEGPHSNVIKIKPPMCFTRDNVDTVVNVLHRELSALETTADS